MQSEDLPQRQMQTEFLSDLFKAFLHNIDTLLQCLVRYPHLHLLKEKTKLQRRPSDVYQRVEASYNLELEVDFFRVFASRQTLKVNTPFQACYDWKPKTDYFRILQ